MIWLALFILVMKRWKLISYFFQHFKICDSIYFYSLLLSIHKWSWFFIRFLSRLIYWLIILIIAVWKLRQFSLSYKIILSNKFGFVWNLMSLLQSIFIVSSSIHKISLNPICSISCANSLLSIIFFFLFWRIIFIFFCFYNSNVII